MENAGEALKIAAFTLLFVTALSLAMSNLMKAKRVSEEIIKYSDKTTLFSYIEQEDIDTEVDKYGNRIVKFNSIIPTLYKYKDEEYFIEFYNASGNALDIFDLDKDNTNIYDADYTGIFNLNSEKCSINFLNYNIENEILHGQWQNNIRDHVDTCIKNIIGKDISFESTFIEEVTETTNTYYPFEFNIQNPTSTSSLEEKTYRVIKYTLYSN